MAMPPVQAMKPGTRCFFGWIPPLIEGLQWPFSDEVIVDARRYSVSAVLRKVG